MPRVTAALALMVGLIAIGSGAPSPASAIVHAGDVAPNFTKTDLDGIQHTLHSYRGKVVVMFILGYG